MKRAIAMVVAGLLGLSVLTSCYNPPKKTKGEKDNKIVRPKVKIFPDQSFIVAKGDDLKIDQKQLVNHNFEKVWDLPIKFNGQYDRIDKIFLVGDSLYVYTKKEKFLHRVDRRSGMVKWSFRLLKGITFRPTIYEYSKEEQKLTGIRRADELFVMSKERLYCLDKEFGVELWSVDLGEISPSAPCGAHKNHVYVCGWDDRLYAFSKKTKTEAWRFRTDDDIRAAPVGAPPASKKDIVFFASTDGRVYALNAFNGSAAWSPFFPTYRRILVPPVYYKTWVYVGSADYNVYCLRSDNGTLKWSHICESPIVTAPVPIRVKVYAIAKDRYLHCLHYSTGKLFWKYPSTRDTVELTNGEILTGKILSDSDFTDELEFRNKGKVVRLDKSSIKNINYSAHKVNPKEAPQKVLARGRKNIFVLNNKKEICAIDDKTGDLLWKIRAGAVDYFFTNTADYSKLSQRPDAGTIYLAFKSGWIVAVRERDKF